MNVDRFSLFSTLVFCAFQLGLCGLPRVELAQLMQNKLIDVYPLCYVGQKIPVSLHLSLQRISYDDSVESMVTIWTIYMNWTDCNFSWQPSDYGNLTNLEVPLSKPIWKPDITWREMSDFDDSLNLVLNKTRVIASYEGQMSIILPILIHTYCASQPTYFPFDSIVCTFTFFSQLHNKDELVITNLLPYASLDQYSEDDIWNLLWCNATSGYMDHLSGASRSYVRYTMVLQRKPLYYLYFILFPYLTQVVVGLSVFLLPEESGEKVGLIMNQIVCLAVFMTLLSGEICSGTEHIPLMGIYFAILFGVLCLACIATIFTCYIHAKGESSEPMPRWLKVLFVEKLAPALLCTSRQNDTEVLDEVKAIEIFGLQATRSEWEVMSVTIDRIFLIFFSLVTIVSSITFGVIGVSQYQS